MMKTALFASMIIEAILANSVPLPRHTPGWHLGARDHAEFGIHVFYDLLCPDSLAAHNVWKAMLNTSSPVEGKMWGDIVHLSVNAFVLPYHLHSY